MGATFTARYRGQCADCEAGISPGDEALFVEGRLTHALCPMENDVTTPDRLCSSCFMELPKAGTCGNCG